MLTEYYLDRYTPIELVPGIRTGCPGLYISGSTVSSALFDYGEIVRQEFQSLQYAVRCHFYNMARPFMIRTVRETPGLMASAILQNQCKQTICGSGRFSIEEGHFYSLYGKDAEIRMETSPEKTLITLDTAWNESLLEQFMPEVARPWREDYAKHPHLTQLISSPYRKITEAQKAIIHQLVYSPYAPSLQRLALDEQIKEYLYLTVRELYNTSWLTGSIDPSDLEKVFAARDLIERDLFTHHFTVDIAARVNMNECKLKMLFKRVTGMGTFDYLLYKRCLRVRDLILNTDLPLKAFVQEAGYNDLANFVKGFQRHLGCYPSSLRKKKLPPAP